MRRISRTTLGRPVLSFASALVGGLAVLAAFQVSLSGRENAPAPKLNVQTTPVNRDARGVPSYSPVIKRAAPSVVNIYSTRTVRMRRMPMMPLFNDPTFRQFFPEDNPYQGDPDQPNRRGRGRSPRNGGDTITEQSLGSGVIVSSDGYVLTANHVVEGADSGGVKVALASGGKTFTAKIVGTDPLTDVAVLKIDATDLSAIAIADSDQLEVGDVVLAIGNPFGVGQTVTTGIVSGIGRTSVGIIREGYENFIQTDAAINQGNSGGALIDAEGRLIGINSAIYSPSGGSAGVGFAVPINLARGVMERLIKYGKVTRGFLGVGLQPEITSDLAETFNLPDQSGAMVARVTANSPAAKAGLRNGDVIREVDGKKVADDSQLRLAISQTAPGTKVSLKILRSEPGRKPAEKTVAATLEALPGDLATAGNRGEPEQDAKVTVDDSLDGVEVGDIDGPTRRQLRIPTDVQGALVTNLDANSNAAKAGPIGLREGDVILEIDREAVRNATDAVEFSKKAKGKRVLLLVWREGGSFYITVDNAKPAKG